MDKLQIKYLLIIVFILQGVFASGQEYNLCQNKNTAFTSGERLSYSLYYNWGFVWIPAGHLEFFIFEEGDEYVAEVRGKTFDSYNWFFEVDDFYTGRIDKETLLPKWYYRDIKEGDFSLQNEIEFNRHIGMIRSEVVENNKTSIKYIFELEGCIHDLISLSYNLRNINIEEFKKQKILIASLVFDENIFHIPFHYVGIEKQKKVKNIGKMDLLKVSPDLIAGNVFKKGSKMMIWVTDDSNRIPVLVETPVKVGSIKAILKKYENIRTPWVF